jgi:hypothetical protein
MLAKTQGSTASKPLVVRSIASTSPKECRRAAKYWGQNSKPQHGQQVLRNF